MYRVLYDSSARPQTVVFLGGTKEAPGGTHEAAGGPGGTRRHPGGTRRHPGGTRRHPGGTEEAPRRHQETPRRHPGGGTRRHPGGQEAPRRPEATWRLGGSFCIVKMGSKSNERPFRVDETSASVTVVRYLHDFSVNANSRGGVVPTTGPRNGQDPSMPHSPNSACTGGVLAVSWAGGCSSASRGKSVDAKVV